MKNFIDALFNNIAAGNTQREYIINFKMLTETAVYYCCRNPKFLKDW